MNDQSYQIRCYTSYSGVGLPLKLVSEISEPDLRNRNTYFQGCFDQNDRLCICRKIVYGETEFEHRYSYHQNGNLKQAIINKDEEDTVTLTFDSQGKPMA